MKANELRIGNWVNSHGNPEQVQYDVQLQDMVYLKDHGYAGVPLTEEWLVKFGLKKEHVSGWDAYLIHSKPSVKFTVKWWAKFDDGKFEGIDLQLTEDYDTKFFAWEDDYLGEFDDFKYVHQLQNLYHSLTGEELTIKENAGN